MIASHSGPQVMKGPFAVPLNIPTSTRPTPERKAGQLHVHFRIVHMQRSISDLNRHKETESGDTDATDVDMHGCPLMTLCRDTVGQR